MKAKRVIYIILAALLLTEGCTVRTVPLSADYGAAASTAAVPAAVPAEKLALPEAESTPAPEPTPEPAPCLHPSWTDGVCAVCGALCPHTEHDAETRRCLVCGQVQFHSFVDGVCAVCGAEPVFEDENVPEEYLWPAAQQGTVETVTYTTTRYRGTERWEGTEVEKSMSVYLPYGYDPEQQYDVLILMHGLGDREQYWLGENREYGEWSGRIVRTADMLDNLIETRYCRGLIVAAPTFYYNDFDFYNYNPQGDGTLFWTELRYDVLPYLVEHYSTYAESSAEEDIIAARSHFGYIGLSMGSIIGFQSVLPRCLDETGWVGCLSGFGTEAYYLSVQMENNGMTDYPILYLYNGCGAYDTAYQEHLFGYEQMLRYLDMIEEGKNTCFVKVLNAKHEYKGWLVGLYNCLQVFFTLPA